MSQLHLYNYRIVINCYKSFDYSDYRVWNFYIYDIYDICVYVILCHSMSISDQLSRAEAVARSIDEEVTGAARRQLSTYEWPEEIMGYPWRYPKIGGKSMENHAKSMNILLKYVKFG